DAGDTFLNPLRAGVDGRIALDLVRPQMSLRLRRLLRVGAAARLVRRNVADAIARAVGTDGVGDDMPKAVLRALRVGVKDVAGAGRFLVLGVSRHGDNEQGGGKTDASHKDPSSVENG